MVQITTTFICPKQLLELPAYRQANNPTRAKMVGFCTLLCISGGLYGEFVQLPSSSLERFLSLKGFKTIRNAIATIIECDEHFSYRKEGHRKALGYRYTPQISAADFVAVQLKTKSGQQFSEPSGQMYRPDVFVSGNLLPVHQKLFHCLSKFTIDAPNLPRALESLSFVKQVIATWNAQKWMRGEFFFIVGETGRVYSSGSNLKKETRFILLVNGEPVVEIDVSCCQPVLLSFLMKGYISDAEHQEFTSLTQSGLLYDEIASASNNSRENVKKALVKWLCGPWFLDEPFIDFDKLALLSEDDRKEKLELHDSLTKVNQWFKVRFPDICEYMRLEKTNDEYYRLFNTAERRDAGRSTQPYAVIAHKLQRLESQIIIEDCCASLFETYPSLPILTAHDSLIVPESMKEQVLEQMTKSFVKKGLKPRITIKSNNKR
jgi:hypothetical protein